MQVGYDVLAFFPPTVSLRRSSTHKIQNWSREVWVSVWCCDAAVAASRSRLDVYIHQFKNHQEPAVTPNVSLVAFPWGHCGWDWRGELEGRKIIGRDFGRHQFLCLEAGVKADAPCLTDWLKELTLSRACICGSCKLTLCSAALCNSKCTVKSRSVVFKMYIESVLLPQDKCKEMIGLNCKQREEENSP